MAYIKLDTIVKQLCRRTGEPEYRNYDDILEHVVSGFRQLNLLSLPVVSKKALSINNYNALDWPTDCVSPIAVGQARNGRTVFLSIDDSICQKNMECESITEAEKQIEAMFYGPVASYEAYNFGEVGEMYGYGCGYNHLGYVTHDKQKRQSYIKGRYEDGDEFVFIYKSDGVSCGFDMIPSEAEMCIKSFALREYYLIKNPGLSAGQHLRYKEEFTALKKFNTAMSKDEWLDTLMQLYNPTP